MSAAQSAVRFFAPDHPALTNTLRKKLEERRPEILEEFAYRSDPRLDDERRGKLLMLDEVLDMCEKLERELNGDNA